MAFLQCNLFSEALCFGTNINVIIPSPNSDEVLNGKDSSYFHTGSRFQVLYLLHGAYGDYSDWMRMTGIERYANDHKLIVVMPSASNSFYQDMYCGSDYLTYVSKELPQFVKTMFPASTKRENTFVAGLSMGGYGAFKIAFENPDAYAACISLSGAVDLNMLYEETKAGRIAGPFDWNAVFANPEGITGSSADLFALFTRMKKEGHVMPRVFQSVGTEDFIYQNNQSGRKKLMEAGADLTYEEHPGIHDWNYWDENIKRAIAWLPLAEETVGE